MKNIKIILFTLLALVIVLVAASCGEVTESISVSETDKFQSVYVLGQELNLSGGVLKVEGGGKTSEIPLDSDGVTVSGYDSNKLGKQTVTVEYNGATAEITVTVAERMTVNNVITDYLVGDVFDKSRGNVKITDYDGTSRTVQLSDSAVSVSKTVFDEPAMGLDVKVTYRDGGEVIEGSFKANVYAVESVELRRPNKITYGSHYEGAPDASGGYFILKGNGGTIRREAGLTSDMISGLDVSVVNEENPEKTQQLTVTYGGKTYTYEVQISYTSISLFNDNKAAFDEIVWDGESEPKIGDTTGALAVKLMNAYLDMNDTERAAIEADYVFDVARTAMMWGFDVWGNDILLFKDAFAIEYGETVLYLKSYDKVKEALALFDDEDSAIYTVAPLLLDLIEMYGDQVIYENETTRICFSTYPVMDRYALTVMEAMLEHAIDIYDTVKDVPEGCEGEDILAYSTVIEAAITKMLSKSYINEYPDIYYLVSDWRGANDLFDIFYNYLYEAGKENVIAFFSAYGLPSSVYELYRYVEAAVVAMDDIRVGRYTDTSNFFYNYFAALKCAEEIKSKTESMEKYVYKNVSLNKIIGVDGSQKIDFEVMFDYMRTVSGGYYDLSAGLLDVAEYEAIIKEYVSLLENVLNTEGYESSDAYGESVKSIFDKFVALSPMQQYNLISTFCSRYSHGIPEFAFDDSGENAEKTTLFALIINDFMRSKLSDGNAEIYNDLILAIEVYANRFGYAEWEDDFVSRMNKLASKVGSLEGADSDNFAYYLSGAYTKYAKIKDELNSTPDLGDFEDEFSALNNAVVDMHTAYYYMSVTGAHNYNYFLASFEKASEIAERILKNAPESVIAAYYHAPLFEAYPEDTEKGEAAVFWTYDCAINTYRSRYIDMLVFFDSAEVNIYDVYLEKGIDKFLLVYYDMISAFVNQTEGEGPVFDKTKTLAAIEAFRALDSSTKALFMMLEADKDMYYSALAEFIAEAFTEAAAEVATKLYALENSYYNYDVTASDVALTSIREILSELKTLYNELEGEDKASFEPLESAYLYYVEKCEKILG